MTRRARAATRTGGLEATAQPDIPPTDAAALSAWLREGVNAEVEALERKGSMQRFELLTGTKLSDAGPGEAIYQFLLADGTRVPEDADGQLHALGREFSATVLSQQGNRIQLLVAGDQPLPDGFMNALFEVDDTALLKKLAEVLESVRSDGGPSPTLPVAVFHPTPDHAGTVALPSIPELASLDSELSGVLRQCLGSSITFIWGPPGTGKTYAIARLIAALVANGERVLLTSHTHAAIDKALFETVSHEAGRAGGPLAQHPYIAQGRIVRVGRVSDTKVPESVRLDAIVEQRSAAVQHELIALTEQAQPLTEERSRCRAQLAMWSRVADLERDSKRYRDAVTDSDARASQAEIDLQEGAVTKQRLQVELEAARRAWWGRDRKVRKASQQLTEAGQRQGGLETDRDAAASAKARALAMLSEVEHAVARERGRLSDLPSIDELNAAVQRCDAALRDVEARINELQSLLTEVQQTVINDAAVICCTLTKNYVGRELAEQEFDAVVVDEISMALPPLLYLAARRARRRVVLVGDFLQLPPIVRSDTDISSTRLKQDIFHMAGVADGNRPRDGVAVLARLTTQRRMVPDIADAARLIAYGPDTIRDDVSVLSRTPNPWLEFLPPTPLVIVDTADLHTWSGKQAGSLSRFNFYTAKLAVELAAMASRFDEPSVTEPPPVGVVTPFAAQRRLLTRLTRDLGLTPWVMAGTVHTFQGSEASLIIFDSVLDEPYWSSRLTNPNAMSEVVRDLNVAVTRARDKFVFLGSSEWLNKRAKAGSGLGLLWEFLKQRADLVAATDLIEDGFMSRVATTATEASQGWTIPQRDAGPVHEILDEESFFPRFLDDLSQARESVFGLVPFFGSYRWPLVEPSISAALARGVDVTFVIPPPSEAANEGYVSSAITHLRESGAVVVIASGLHGKDIVIDERVHYTGSLNWASHRGRREVMHRTESTALAKLVLQFLQARFIRASAVHEDGAVRTCPVCGGPTHVVNQRRQHGAWDNKQAVKVGCANPACQKYLRDVDERAPFRSPPVCDQDGRTKKRRLARGRGEVWQCPKHPKGCRQEKVVPGDPS